MTRGYPFDERLVRLLRDGQRSLSALAVRGHHALYDHLREVVASAMKVDAFYVALFRDPGHVLYAYQYDGSVYALPGLRELNPDGPTGWVFRNRRSYRYRDDGGAVLDRGIPWGDRGRRSADALVVPMRRTGTDEVIGVVSAQTYTSDSYGDAELAALEWLAEVLARMLSTEEENRRFLETLDDGERPAVTRVLSRSMADLVVERVSVVRAAAAELRDALEAAGHPLLEPARELVRECERLQVDTAEMEFDSYRQAAERFESLSAREREVAGLLAEGRTNDEIRERLHIELPTVKTHVGKILRKYGVRQRSAAAAEISAYLGSVRPPG
ncbi:LuxR C-terminal-related transcriptional regulator [Amycolatopsis sp. MtRt-6]|uniref:LuxR C-terminal-related transcriptional regulator n=1 Tax=Amycolatopsis sp. MtRt-6 TaxID=2792782 RepID=UPI001A8CB367|nr:LuxR C-terminal-related transcriptional regulator [Amycolatopsis sp. MtRt-6]